MKNIKIHIPEPCHEDWNTMLPSQKGKFCLSCKKEVTDFTKYSTEEIIHYFEKNLHKKICGRFVSDQLAKTYTIKIAADYQWTFQKLFLFSFFIVFGFIHTAQSKDTMDSSLVKIQLADTLIEVDSCLDDSILNQLAIDTLAIDTMAKDSLQLDSTINIETNLFEGYKLVVTEVGGAVSCIVMGNFVSPEVTTEQLPWISINTNPIKYVYKSSDYLLNHQDIKKEKINFKDYQWLKDTPIKNKQPFHKENLIMNSTTKRRKRKNENSKATKKK